MPNCDDVAGGATSRLWAGEIGTVFHCVSFEDEEAAGVEVAGMLLQFWGTGFRVGGVGTGIWEVCEGCRGVGLDFCAPPRSWTSAGQVPPDPMIVVWESSSSATRDGASLREAGWVPRRVYPATL